MGSLRGHRRHVLAVALAVASLAAACSTAAVAPRDDAAIADAAPPDASDAAAVPFPLGQRCAPVTLPEGTEAKECAECGQSLCCDTRNAFFSFADAPDLQKCVSSSSCDSKCEEACFAKHPGPTQATLDHATCLEYRCPSCRAKPATACETCIHERCTTEDLACSRSSACFVLRGCVGRCAEADKACVTKCTEDFPAARDTLAALVLCQDARCPAECPK